MRSSRHDLKSWLCFVSCQVPAPMCINTCPKSNFPKNAEMSPLSDRAVLARESLTYKCNDKRKIPSTGEEFQLQCLDNGKFEVRNSATLLLQVLLCTFWPTLCTSAHISE